MLNVHISGRVVFFKSINRDQDVTRSAFKPMPSNTSVQDAVDPTERYPLHPLTYQPVPI